VNEKRQKGKERGILVSILLWSRFDILLMEERKEKNEGKKKGDGFE